MSPPLQVPDEDLELLSPRRILVSTVLAILGLMVAIGILGLWFREPLLALSRVFVEVLGGPGIAVGFFVPDAFTIPIPNDAFGMFGIAGGLGFWEVVAWGAAGSILGGSTGWLIGGQLRRSALVDGFLNGRGARFASLVRRYGLVVVAVAAITPLPYSVSAWAAGAVRMPYGHFFAVSLLRVFRVAGALYLIELGLLGTG